MHRQLEDLRDAKNKLNSREETIKELERALETEETKSAKYYNLYDETINKLEIQTKQTSGENDPFYLREKNELLSIENKKLTEALNKTKFELDAALLEIDGKNEEMRFLVDNLKTDAESLTSWVETYLGTFYPKNYEIPDLPESLMNEQISALEELKKAIKQARNKNINEKEELNEEIANLTEQNEKLHAKNKKLNEEIVSLQSKFNSKSSVNFTLQDDFSSISRNLAQQTELNGKLKKELENERERMNSFTDRLYNEIKKTLEKVRQNASLTCYSELYNKITVSENIVSS